MPQKTANIAKYRVNYGSAADKNLIGGGKRQAHQKFMIGETILV